MLCSALTVLLFCSVPLFSQDTVNHPQAFGISAPLGELAKLPQPLNYGFHEANPVRRVPKHAIGGLVDPVEQNYPNGPQANYSIGADFLGVGNGFPNYTVPDAPPDTTMAVGDTQVVQWVNTSYTVCSKTSPYTCGPAVEGNVLWSGLSGTPLCKEQNDGDIIAQWDVVAHRWLLTQNVFASPYAVCVAISTTPDANGTYYLYQFGIPGNGFPDYPKWGIWPTNYGQSQNNFGTGSFIGPLACVYNRTKMLTGDPSAEQICHQYTASEDSLLPADQDTATNPPSGQDQFFIGSVGDVDTSHLSLYSAHINNPADWSKGATWTGDGNSQLIAIASFTPACNGAYGGDCVPQKGITDKADSLGDRLMYRFAYSNDGSGGSQHWLVNFDVTASGSQGGVRWMEITAPPTLVAPSGLSVYQQGTWAPDGNWRWMGSLARDKQGNILLGYSESCGSTCPGGTAMYPSVYVAGRLVGDALGTLEPELQVVAGAGSQPDTSNRWGDYSSMRIDQDGCTFWYTQEYYKVTSTFDWSTQVGSFTFAGCSGSGGAQVSLEPTSLKWGKIGVGTKGAAKKVVLTNTGTGTLNITTIATTGDFALATVTKTKKVTPCVNGGTVAAGATCEVKVTFTPTQTGTRTGSLQFTDNAPASPQSVSLTGTGK